MARFNAKAKAESAIENWAAENPQEPGESKAKYRRRMQAGVAAELKSEAAGSVWVAILPFILQFLPLMIEWFLNRQK